MNITAGALAATLLALPQLLSAQHQGGASLRLDLTNVWTRTDFPTTPSILLRGPAVGGEGRVALGSVFLSVRYLEGRLSPRESGSTFPHQDLVEGSIAAVVRPVSWFELSFGPTARAYVTDTTTERWVSWRLRSRVEAPLIATRLTSYFELWKSVTSSLNVPTGAGRVQGGETGVAYRPIRSPVTVSVSYHIDDSLFKGIGQSETLEWLSVGVRIGGD